MLARHAPLQRACPSQALRTPTPILRQHSVGCSRLAGDRRPRASGGAGAPPIDCDVAVVGAGPAGLAAANALRVADPSLRVAVLERTSMAARGAAVLVGVNGLLALEAIDPGLLQGLLAKAIKLEGSDRYSKDSGEWLEFLPMRNDDFKQTYGYHNALLGWSDIVAALRAGLPPDAVTPNCPVTGYEQRPDGRLALLGQQQQVVAHCRALVGADGWFSAVRQQVLADGPPTFKDAVVWRARIPRPDWMPEAKTKWWIPPGGPSQAQLLAVFIPVPGGEMVWQAHAPLSLMQGKGLAFDPVSGEAATSSHATADAQPGARAGGASAKARCLQALRDFPDAFTSVVAGTEESAITEHGLYQRTPEQIPDAWGTGMVTLAGDAAHTAFVDGTGLALSLEDAAVLGWHVRRAGLSEAALRSYEAARVPRVRAVFSLAAQQAAAMAAGVPQKQLLQARADLLYGEAKFEPIAAAPAAAVA